MGVWTHDPLYIAGCLNQWAAETVWWIVSFWLEQHPEISEPNDDKNQEP